MNILAIGDIVGDVGTDMFIDHIDGLKKQYDVDFCIVNAENASQNNGITRKKAELLLENGADVLTLGNHTFRQKDAFSLLAITRVLSDLQTFRKERWARVLLL